MRKHVYVWMVAFSVFLTACKKDDNKAPETSAPTTTAANKGSFIWKAGSAASVKADSAYYYASFTTIYAFKNGLNSSVEINLSALSAGNYSLSSVTGNDLTFVSGSGTYTASSGNCAITAAAGNSLSGTFTAALSGGTLATISGTFEGIAQR